MTELARRRAIAPSADSYESIVGALERVELEARERRLTAQSEADRIRLAAQATAADLAAGVPARIGAALAELRAGHLAAADAEVDAMEERLVAGDGSSERAGAVAPITEAAVELLVAAVLAERNG